MENAETSEELSSPSPEEKIENYDTIVLSGGAAKGMILLGALQCATDKNLLTNIVNYVGASIGSIIGYLLAIGYSPIEIMVYICTHRMIERMQYFNLVAMINGEGASSFRTVQETLEKMTLDKLGRFLTMKELYEQYGKNLVCATYNTTTEKIEYISHENYPDLPCLIALRMTAGVPLLFDKFKYMGNYYVDGGIADNFPIVMGDKIGKKVLGIRLYKQKGTYTSEEEIGVLEYIFKLIYVTVNQSTEYRCSLASDRCTIVAIPENDTKMFDFNIKSRVKLEMFSEGYRAFLKHLQPVAEENQ
jgi:NTE family protein